MLNDGFVSDTFISLYEKPFHERKVTFDRFVLFLRGGKFGGSLTNYGMVLVNIFGCFKLKTSNKLYWLVSKHHKFQTL